VAPEAQLLNTERTIQASPVILLLYLRYLNIDLWILQLEHLEIAEDPGNGQDWENT
jgi:hypothetical protein